MTASFTLVSVSIDPWLVPRGLGCDVDQGQLAVLVVEVGVVGAGHVAVLLASKVTVTIFQRVLRMERTAEFS
jgi:hypothetical protein